MKTKKVSRHLLKKLNAFTKERFDLIIAWKTKKFEQLFSLKEKNPYHSCKIYIGETKRNVTTRWNKHENQAKVHSKQAKQLLQHHVFQWKVLMSAPMSIYRRKKPGGILYSSETSNLS